MNTNRILVNYAGDHTAWTDVVEFLAEDMAIIQWTQPDGTVVRGTADYEGDRHPETGEPVFAWDGDMYPVDE